MSSSRTRDEDLFEMFHFYESIDNIRSGLNLIVAGLADFEAGVENLGVFFDRFDELAQRERVEHEHRHVQHEVERMQRDYDHRSHDVVPAYEANARASRSESSGGGFEHIEVYDGPIRIYTDLGSGAERIRRPRSHHDLRAEFRRRDRAEEEVIAELQRGVRRGSGSRRD